MTSVVTTTNSLLKAKGLYDDVIHVIGDFLYGTKKDYKRIFSKSAEQIKLEPRDRLNMTYHMRGNYGGMLGNTTDAKWAFADFNECRKRLSISYNQYIWENRQYAPLTAMYMVRKVREYIARIEQANRTHHRLTGCFYRKKKMIFNEAYGIDERYITTYFRFPDYYEGEISIAKKNEWRHFDTITFPYFKTPPRHIQTQKRDVCLQLKTNYNLKEREKKRSEFKKGYILIENDFLKIEVERVANGKLYCKQTAKPLTCSRGHSICERIYKRNKIKTKKMTYDIREIHGKIGDPPCRLVRFMVGMTHHHQSHDTRTLHQRREFALWCDTGENIDDNLHYL